MTTDTQQHEQEIEDNWLAFWTFINTQIRWNSQDIDFDEFYKKGKKLFEIKEKTV